MTSDFTVDAPTVSTTDLMHVYEKAQRIRAFDDYAQELIAGAQAFFVHYPVRGHEIIAAAVGTVLDSTDYVTATYRGLGEEIAKGLPLEQLWAERLGKRTGASKGRGGPMHISDPDLGLMVMSGIVGGGIPIASGLALASQLRDDGRVTVCNFGDGASNIGAFHEAINLAAVWNLPVVFLCQNNQYGEHTPIAEVQKNTVVADRAIGYGIRGVTVDGTDAAAALGAVREAVDHARAGRGPVLLECVTFRTLGHVLGDQNEYMDQKVLKAHRASDLLDGFRSRLLEDGVAASELDRVEVQVKEEVVAAYKSALLDDDADPAAILDDIWDPTLAVDREPSIDTVPNQRMTMREAIRDALDLALTSDDDVMLLGEDIADSAGGGVFHITTGLSTKHGDRRVRNTPIAEEAIIGAAVGAAIAGMKPIAEIMFMDFLTVGLDQLVNHAAKLRYMSGGRTPVPMVVRVNMFGGTPIGAQHSQSNEALLMHSPGLKVVWPSTAFDAKGLLLASIADGDPCVFIETTSLMNQKGDVPEGHYTIPIGKAAVRQSGSDVTVISWGRMMAPSLKAAAQLEADGIAAEIIDLRSLAPIDYETIFASVAKTGRAVIVHEAVRICGPGAEIGSRIHEELFGRLHAPVRRITAPDSPVPASSGLVAAFYPAPEGIADACRSLLTYA